MREAHEELREQLEVDGLRAAEALEKLVRLEAASSRGAIRMAVSSQSSTLTPPTPRPITGPNWTSFFAPTMSSTPESVSSILTS